MIDGSDLARRVGRRMRVWRDAAGLSTQAASGRVGIPVPLWNNYENGVRNPSLEALAKLARGMQVTPAYLLKAEGEDWFEPPGLTQEVLRAVEGLHGSVERLCGMYREAVAK